MTVDVVRLGSLGFVGGDPVSVASFGLLTGLRETSAACTIGSLTMSATATAACITTVALTIGALETASTVTQTFVTQVALTLAALEATATAAVENPAEPRTTSAALVLLGLELAAVVRGAPGAPVLTFPPSAA